MHDRGRSAATSNGAGGIRLRVKGAIGEAVPTGAVVTDPAGPAQLSWQGAAARAGRSGGRVTALQRPAIRGLASIPGADPPAATRRQILR